MAISILTRAVAICCLLSGLSNAQETSPKGPTFPGTVKNCNAWHTVVQGDSCATVETKYEIQHKQFIQWNPDVSQDCTKNFWLGNSYCVGVSKTPPPTTTSSTKTNGPPTPAPSPTQPGTTTKYLQRSTAPGTTTKCNRWHVVVEGDDCAVVEKKYGIAHADFIKWNPAVPSDCKTNFWKGYAYCVSIDPNAPEITSTTSSTKSSITSSSSSINSTYSTRLPITSDNITTPTVGTDWPPKETQAGRPKLCNLWHLATGSDTCVLIAERYRGLTLEKFLSMNPEVHSDCSGLFVDWWYCVGTKPESSLTLTWNPTTSKIDVPNPTSFTPSVTPTMTEPVTPTPFDSGMVKGCDGFYQASTSQNCQGILKVYSIISEKQLLDWNPGLKGDCNAFKSGYWYCVADFASMTFPLPSTTAGLPSPPAEGAYTKDCVGWYQVAPLSLPAFPTEAPVQTGIKADCSKFWHVSRTDTCDKIVRVNGISLADFLSWNPAVGSSCDNLKSDYNVCVGIGGPVRTSTPQGQSSSPTPTPTSLPYTSTSSSFSIPPTTKSSGGVATPLPTQVSLV
ncbi:hypothetical protein EsHS_00006410 [Epichloe bromicola]